MLGKIFDDREDAGRVLGRRLVDAGFGSDVLVFGLPRGGVPVACAVGAALEAVVAPLVVRKLGAPFNPELAVGAIACGGVTVYNQALLAELGLRREDLAPVRERELAELARRERAYGAGEPPKAAGRTAIVVDDGMATGATMHAAVLAVRALGARRVVVAVPTASRDAVERLQTIADEVIALVTPEPYYGVGAWYGAFPQLADREVVACLAESARRVRCAGRRADPRPSSTAS